jgi:type IV pilus assembly protein PilY1
VTDPANVLFLWEKNGTDITALGKNIGRPVIAQVANGDWRVLLGNGPGSSGGSAQFITIGLFSGTATTTDTGATGSNGLSAVLARDSNVDGFADIAYAGDLKGHVWKITGIAGVGTTTSIFTATDGSTVQPITAAPLVGKDPATGTLWVFFGTGQYLGDSDLTTTQTQTWYGIKDTGTAISGRTNLVQRTITASGTIGDFSVRVISAGTTDELTTKMGWYIDLPATGERMVVPNRFQGAALIGTTRIPDATDVCRPSGKGYVMAINPFTGGRLDKTFFDATKDGLFNDSDKLNHDGLLDIVSGLGFDSSPNNPIFVDNIMLVGLDDGSMKTIKTQGSSVEAKRMSWRELLN